MIFRFSNTTVRATLSTCVRAVAKIDAERLFLRAGGLDRERGAEVDLVAVPLVDLRLVDEHLRVGEVDVARPRIGRERRRGGRGGATPATTRSGQRAGERGEDGEFWRRGSWRFRSDVRGTRIVVASTSGT